jgi:hypothetical protein
MDESSSDSRTDVGPSIQFLRPWLQHGGRPVGERVVVRAARVSTYPRDCPRVASGSFLEMDALPGEIAMRPLETFTARPSVAKCL